MTISYVHGRALYVNLTNRCDCACVFCLRRGEAKGSIYADNLWLEHEPTRSEALQDLLSHDLSAYEELVFCGFGEPMYRAADIVFLIDALREKTKLPPVRINTNGHAALILGRDMIDELKGRVDTLSVSLNAATAEAYLARVNPAAGAAAYPAMLEFARAAVRAGISVVMTVVDHGMDPAELRACAALAASCGAAFRVRAFLSEDEEELT